MVESLHRGAAIVADAGGEAIAAFGDTVHPIYPRSSIKPLQALVLVESGALDRYGLTDEHVALACASHSGEPVHVETVRHWLEQLGLDETSLECGAHESVHRKSRNEMIRQGVKATPLHNNCSGKHAGFITTACHLGLPVAGYIKRSHPVQQRVLQTLEELAGESLHNRPCGLDGCGIPITGISLKGVATAFARLSAANFDSSVRQAAARRIVSAMTRFPELVGGEKRFCTEIARVTEGAVLVKVGAEGVYAGMTTGSTPYGFALKIDDGTRRAAEVAMGGLISRYCNLEPSQLELLKPWFEPEVKTVAGRSAGRIRPAIQ